MRKTLDLAGQTFGPLTVLRRSGETATSEWVCRCLCGNELILVSTLVQRRSKPYCRCNTHYRRTLDANRKIRSFEYRVWSNMRTRCRNPKATSFRDYGGRGISVVPRWDSFETFLADMGEAPSRQHSIDRIDVNGHYEPTNCRWATRAEQSSNTRNTRLLSHGGKTLHLAQWAREVGLSEDALERRLNLLHWSVEKALTTPARGWGPGRPRSS